jgi:glycosyltransferase involved in cell wall biosynthesis
MKVVLYLIETSGPGGAENMLIHLVENLDRARYRPIIGLLKDGWLATQLRQRGFETITMPQRGGHDPGWIYKCIRLIHRKGIDILHTHEFNMNTYGSIASLVTGVPVVATVHGAAYYGEKWRRRMAYRFVAKQAMQMVAVSESIRRFLIERVGANSEKLCTIYNGVDVEAYRFAQEGMRIRQELGIEETTPVVGTIANLYPVKGHTFLLKAAAQVARVYPRTVWLLAGRGMLLGQLQDEARELGLSERIRFLGFRDDAAAVLQALDLFVLPSLSEGLPLVVLEAMAAGKPVVATDVGGNREVVVDGETGYLVPPRDPNALASGIVALLRDKRLAHRYGAVGRQRVLQQFNLARMVAAYQALYAREAGGNGR